MTARSCSPSSSACSKPRAIASPPRALLSQEQVLALAPDALVLELVTPDGVDLEWDYLTRLRRDREATGLPVVLCTTAS
jgi:hypothetical protein